MSEQSASISGKIVTIVFAVLLIFSLGGLVYMYMQNSKVASDLDKLTQEIEIRISQLESTVVPVEDENPDDAADTDNGNEEPDKIQEGVLDEDLEIGLRDRKVVVLDNDDTVIPPRSEIVSTFDIDDAVEILTVNESQTYFAYGVYLSDHLNVNYEKLGASYTWYLYEVATGDITELNGLEFTNAVDDSDAEVEKVFGWRNDSELVLGEDGVTVYLGMGSYDVGTGEITPLTEAEYIDLEFKVIQ